MTPEEIKKQMMGSAGISHGVQPVSAKSNIKMVTETNSNGQPADSGVILQWIRSDVPQGELKYIALESNDCSGLMATSDEHAEFMQAAAMPEGAVPPEGFDLQYREGSRNEHFAMPRLVSLKEVEQALLKYAAGDQSFKTDFEWQKLSQGDGETESGATGDGTLSTPAQPPAPANAKPPREKSMVLAVVLAFFFGPFGVFYVSWKRALVMLLLFIVGVSVIPKNGFVVLLLWLVIPILSIIALGVGRRQDEQTPDEAFWSGKPPTA